MSRHIKTQFDAEEDAISYIQDSFNHGSEYANKKHFGKKVINGLLGNGDYLEVERGSVTINDEDGHIMLDTDFTSILLAEPTGEPMAFAKFVIPCNCGYACKGYAEFHDTGYISVVSDEGERFNTKIDPRYTAAIYKLNRHKQAIEFFWDNISDIRAILTSCTNCNGNGVTHCELCINGCDLCKSAKPCPNCNATGYKIEMFELDGKRAKSIDELWLAFTPKAMR